MLEAKKRDSVERMLFHTLNEKADVAGEDSDSGETGDEGGLQHTLRTARANEHALRQRLHRVRDPKGMELLRDLRAQISCLEDRLGGESEE